MPDEHESRRPTAQIIFERVKEDADEELERPQHALFASAVFAGFTLGASPLALSLALALLTGADERFVAALLYPIGYVAVIVGRAQLFTENTLYPVVSSLEDIGRLPRTGLLWLSVLTGNLVGAAAFALLAVKSPALPSHAVTEFVHIGTTTAAHGFIHGFWAAVFAGWLLALVAWVIEGCDDTIGQIAVIWLLTLPVGLAAFDHSVASAFTMFGALFDGQIGLGRMIGWEGTAILGNALGGVVIVALLNFGQATSRGAEASG